MEELSDLDAEDAARCSKQAKLFCAGQALRAVASLLRIYIHWASSAGSLASLVGAVGVGEILVFTAEVRTLRFSRVRRKR